MNDANRPPKIKPGDTTGWRVFVRPVPGGPDITAWLKRVVFVLHETFPNPIRAIDNPPFELDETGYGGFMLGIRLYFQPYATEKWQLRQHFLTLEAYGDEEQRALQEKENLVRSESVEYIEFNEPTESLWDALTSDSQWDYLQEKPVAKGKGKARAANQPKATKIEESDKTVELPDSAPAGSVYSKQVEDKLIEQLNQAQEQAEKELVKVLGRSKEVNDLLAQMKDGQDVNDKLRELWESLPQKKK